MLRRCSKISFLSKFNKCFHVLFTALCYLIFIRQRFWFTFCYFPAYQLHSLFAAWLVLVMSLFKSGDFQRGTLVLIYYFFHQGRLSGKQILSENSICQIQGQGNLSKLSVSLNKIWRSNVVFFSELIKKSFNNAGNLILSTHSFEDIMKYYTCYYVQ